MNAWRDTAVRLVLLVASLALWEAAVRALRVPAFILPPPSEIGAALYRGALTGIYVRNLWITLAETLLGFSLGSVVAFVLGTALGGLLLLSAFVVIELRRREPMVDLRLLGNGLFRTATLVSLFSSGGFLGVLFVGPLFLQEGLGVTLQV